MVLLLLALRVQLTVIMHVPHQLTSHLWIPPVMVQVMSMPTSLAEADHADLIP